MNTALAELVLDINRNRACEVASTVTSILQERGDISLPAVRQMVATVVENRLKRYSKEDTLTEK